MSSRFTAPRDISRRAALTGLAALLGGCSTTGDLLDDLLGKGDDAPLPGKREALFNAASSAGKAKEPVLIPQAIANTQWLQPGGTASSVVGNPALPEAISRRWRVQAAKTSGGPNRLSAPPIVAGGRVLVLDAFATVRAFDAASGRRLWERPLAAAGADAADGFGGGLCSDGTHVYAATGLGEVVALALSGAELWRVKLPRPLRTPPVYDNGRLFVRDNADVLHALAASNGGKLWDYQGPAGRTRLISAAAPSVRGALVVCPFSGGELVALSTAGHEKWSLTLSAASTIADIAARPVIGRSLVFGVAALGHIAAAGAGDGVERWSLPLGGRNTPWLAGNYLFHVQGRGSLHAIHAATGRIRWSSAPGGTLAGPVMGGGRLLAGTSSGELLEILAEGGQVLKRHKIGAAVRIAPVVARGSAYVLDDDGGLSRLA